MKPRAQNSLLRIRAQAPGARNVEDVGDGGRNESHPKLQRSMCFPSQKLHVKSVPDNY